MSGALTNPVYRHLLAAQVLSILGSGLITVALGLLAYELAGADAAIVLGIALTLKMVAYVGLAPIAAALTTRLPRRAFLVILDVCRAVPGWFCSCRLSLQCGRSTCWCCFSGTVCSIYADLSGHYPGYIDR